MFQKLLFNYIDSKVLKDSDVYNNVHIDRRLFSKIRSDCDYHCRKQTWHLFNKLPEKYFAGLWKII